MWIINGFKKYNMSATLFPFQLGTFRLMVISDGAFPVTKDFFFANTPEDIIHHIPSDFHVPLNFMLIDTGDKNILIDAGFGKNHLPTAGKLLGQLETLGIYPEDIDIVIITHGHMDHVGGLSYDKSPTFPNAEYVIRKEEWDLWESKPQSKEFKKLEPIRNQMKLITSDIEIVPGVHLLLAPGHTTGHLSLSLFSEGNYLMVASDILNDPLTLQHLSSHIRAEMTPDLGLKTRMRFLQDAIEKEALLFVCHYPFPGVGRVKREGSALVWVPVMENTK
jgi:glyoxylase-like metal-dependent hydrolase (beta-lactamase superfamily II)